MVITGRGRAVGGECKNESKLSLRSLCLVIKYSGPTAVKSR